MQASTGFTWGGSNVVSPTRLSTFWSDSHRPWGSKWLNSSQFRLQAQSVRLLCPLVDDGAAVMATVRLLQELRGWIRDGGDPDLYRGIRALDKRTPIRPELLSIFMRTAEIIRNLFPQRVNEPLRHSIDAIIFIYEFNGNPETTRADVLLVLDVLLGQLRSTAA
jgi:hypothetical protein